MRRDAARSRSCIKGVTTVLACLTMLAVPASAGGAARVEGTGTTMVSAQIPPPPGGKFFASGTWIDRQIKARGVVSWYRTHMPDQGWTFISQRTTIRAAGLVMIFRDDGTIMQISVSATDPWEPGATMINYAGADVIQGVPGWFHPEITLPLNLVNASADQETVDLRHQPWLADAAYRAQLYALSVDGVNRITQATAMPRLVLLHKSPGFIEFAVHDNTKVSRIYLRQLIQRGAEGVWTIMGYDPRKPGSSGAPSTAARRGATPRRP